ncbi:MAG TPA: lipocalin-like domain-containing protein [Candidatus Micrarchaeaceae archaeon]|nr:lipocalin-like domain-containing protein [Candidatus Micrarchaeaceae archaeon]
MATLASQLIGTWRLVSREDRTAAGERRVDAGLGADPVALLVFDMAGNFAAQFMKRDRSSGEGAVTIRAGANNSTAVNGYDAYFGNYTVDEGSGSVRTTLEGSLSPEDVGSVFTREMHVDGYTLTIKLATTSAGGEPVTRTLIWKRSA